MDSTQIIMLVFFVLGLVLLFTAFSKKHAGPLKGLNPVMAGVLGVILIIPGFYYGIYPLLPVEETTPPAQVIITPTLPDETHYATFDITMGEGTNIDAGSTEGVSTDLHTYSYPFSSNTTSDNITVGYDADGVWATGITGHVNITFTIVPIAWAGADNDDICTIYYEILDPDQAVDDGAGTASLYLFDKDNGYRQILWYEYSETGVAVKDYISGSKSMILTDSCTLNVRLLTSHYSLAQLADELDTQTVSIVFSNGGGWSETFYVDWLLLHQLT